MRVPGRRTRMTAREEEIGLNERLTLIGTMIAEGRRTTESFSWVFVLWGLAYYVAIAWSTGGFTGVIWGSRYMAWPVTMIATFVLTWTLQLRKGHGRKHQEPVTTL